jgi:hypothetical protein
MMIHRRVKPSPNKYELDLVRLPHPGYSFEDVDTVFPGNNERIVTSGRRQEHKDKYGGISVQSYDEGSNHTSDDGRFKREEGDEPSYGPKPARNINRWHCYKCLRDDIPQTFNVHHDNPPHHGFIYPVNEMNVFESHGHATTTFPVGRFPDISSIKSWTFCCNVLQYQDVVLVAGEPCEEDFKDKGVSVIFYALQLCSSSTSFCDEADDCYNIKQWIMLNAEVDDDVATISRKAPGDIYYRIIYHLENAQAHTSFSDESQSIGDVLNILINSKTNSTGMKV